MCYSFSFLFYFSFIFDKANEHHLLNIVYWFHCYILRGIFVVF